MRNETMLSSRSILILPAMLLACLCILSWPADGSAKIVKRYNGPVNNSDAAYAVGVDGSGNFYVTGRSYGLSWSMDYATVKYNAKGRQKWVKRYNGPANDFDSAQAMAVDESGNVYVTGQSYGKNGKNLMMCCTTIKYDTEGNQEWINIYHGDPSLDTGGVKVSVDSSGNVYVLGYEDSFYNWVIIKYDVNGGQEWLEKYGAGVGGGVPTDLKVDGSGNVYVCGSISAYYTVVKYDTNGNEIWAKADVYGYPFALAVDKTGNVYVTGKNNGQGGDLGDCVTIKYDADGNEQWVMVYDGKSEVENRADRGVAIAVDDTGNAYVSGTSPVDSDRWDYFTLKYDANGNRKWRKAAKGPALTTYWGPFLVADGGGNAYFTGMSLGVSGTDDYLTIKYDTKGKVKWRKRYDGTGQGSDAPGGIAVDGNGYVYVTGQAYGSTSWADYVTIRYDADGK